MPRLDGIAATRIIAREDPDIKIIIITAFSSNYKREDILESGAVSFLDKINLSFDKLIAQIERAAYC